MLTLLLGINLPTESQEFHWYESLVKDEVTILVRDVPDSRYQEFRAIVDLEATPAAAVVTAGQYCVPQMGSPLCEQKLLR